jgi:hypothetical protein
VKIRGINAILRRKWADQAPFSGDISTEVSGAAGVGFD